MGRIASDENPSHRARREHRVQSANEILQGKKNPKQVLAQLRAYGRGNAFGVERDSDFVRAAVDIGRRIKASRQDELSRAYFREFVDIAEKHLLRGHRLTGVQRINVLYQTIQVYAFELGDGAGAQALWDEFEALVPGDARVKPLYRRLSNRYPHYFPPRMEEEPAKLSG